MSAICGIIRTDGGIAERRDLDRQLSALAYCGLDGSKGWTGGQAALAHLLTRVTPEDVLDAQPIQNAQTGVVLVADVRLDNRSDLAAALSIHRAQDLPDSAFLLRAYERWGTDFAQHLLGDFAFALWDRRENQVVLGRDPLGQRHLSYHRGNGFFAFATDIKGLWALRDVPREICEEHLAARLVPGFLRTGPQSLYRGINSVSAGSILIVSGDGRIQERRYWKPHANPAHEGRSESYYIDAYREVLEEAVSCRLRTLKPVGLLLSGGYDSSAIAALAGPTMRAQQRKLIAVASTMPPDYRGTIRHAGRWVEACARHMPHLEVHRVTRQGKSVLTGLEKTYASTEGLLANTHFATTEMLQYIAAAGACVVMDGHGGDYTLNPRGQAALAFFLATGQFRRFIAEFSPHLRMSGHSVWKTLKQDIVTNALPTPFRAALRRAQKKRGSALGKSPLSDSFRRKLIAEGVVDLDAELPEKSPAHMKAMLHRALERVMSRHGCQTSSLASLSGLQLTRPFHDKRVVELALAIPESLYVKNGRNRYLACAALKDLYPPEFQTRWRRNDDEIPDFQRMAKRIEPQVLAEIERLEKNPEITRIIDFGKVRKLLAARGADDHNSGWEHDTRLAMHSFMIARYIDWFQGNN